MNERERTADGRPPHIDELDRLLEGMGGHLAARFERRRRLRSLFVRSGAASAAAVLLLVSIQLARAPTSSSSEGDVSAALSQEPTPTPFTDPPVITNRGELFEALEAEYPAELRAAGVEGTALVYFFVNETGALESATIGLTSGYEEFDEAALRIAELIRFRPALDGGVRVSAWVQVPITFEEEPSPCTRCGGIPGPQPLVPLR